MSERWKPRKDDKYWVIVCNEVVQAEWWADSADLSRWRVGNCFKTKEEAQVAAEKVNKLLLSLHETQKECSPHPKMTAEVFKREDCPEWANYAMVNALGYGYWYEAHPSLVYVGYGHGTKSRLIGCFDSSDWQNSLIERPAKALPEWCKMGEYVYDSRKGRYAIIRDIKGEEIFYQTLDGGVTSASYLDLKPAHLRPYNEIEMRGLVGMVIRNGPSVHFVTGYENVLDGESMVHVNGCLYSANDLLRKGFTYDTRPCGRLEHLENGEWIR